MTNSFRAGIVIAAFIVALPSYASAQEASDGALLVWHPVLAASVERLSAESASWRDGFNALTATGRQTILVTPDAIKSGFDSEKLAQAQPVVDEGSAIDTVVVVVNLELLQRLSGLPVKAIEFERDLDRLVAHEVYGHAIPLLMAGSLSGNCADPAAGQSAADACAIKRENVIRKEMRLGQRFDYGREGLALARRSQQ